MSWLRCLRKYHYEKNFEAGYRDASALLLLRGNAEGMISMRTKNSSAGYNTGWIEAILRFFELKLKS